MINAETIAAVNRILDETVDAALQAQRKTLTADLTAGFRVQLRRETEAIRKKRSFWMRAAVTEGAVLAVITGSYLVYGR